MLPLVLRVVGALAAAGASRWSVGCSSGGDALALSALGAAGLCPSVSVFAVGGPAGSGFAGFWSGSAVRFVSAAVAAGARPVWWAGGPASVSLRSRLARRSGACVRSVAGGGRASAVGVWFLASPSSVGSVSSARLAASLGVPVFVFCVGFPASSLPLLVAGGSWVAVSSGPLAGAWRWVGA